MSKHKLPMMTELYFLDHSFKELNSRINLQAQFESNQSIVYEINSKPQPISLSLCNSLGYSGNDLPWNQLRAMQFELGKNFQVNDKLHTLACCDPVMMQVTHRGAYLWGQRGLNFTKEEVILIIAEINNKLMGEGERFYLLNNHQWLYVNETYIELDQGSFEAEIGRDQFGFSYKGKDSKFWEKLATEIQMLIKQMIDYKGLSNVPAESLVNVCFWGNSNRQLNSSFSSTLSETIDIYVEHHLINQFIQRCKQKTLPLNDFEKIIKKQTNKSLIVCTLEDKQFLTNTLGQLSSIDWKKNVQSRLAILYFQDCEIILQPKPSLFQRLFNV